MSNSIINSSPLSFPWQTEDPFLFCVYHEDFYPVGDDNLGPGYDLIRHRNLGEDFEIRDGFRMYHGTVIPGFPAHPHRGFETVTVVKKGLVDHCDSFGGAARYGNGDTQWLTAGAGVQHSEMFPLLNKEKENPLELFQIWLNLDSKNKMAAPHYKMFWREDQPQYDIDDTNQLTVTIKVTAGDFQNDPALTPPPNSWASNKENCVCIWELEFEANAEFTLPSSLKGVNRNLYFFKGESYSIDDFQINQHSRVKLNPEGDITIKAGATPCRFLLLQGKPINEPVEQYGPFVMNTREEVSNAIRDYQMTEFGGWPWTTSDPTHGHKKGRFAKFPDGSSEVKDKSVKF
jgi:redox-sensitive bicupin YhaK (pirin superfamily)